jgi:hypothetical protein
MNKNIVRLILLVVISLISVSFATAQSLQDNPDYRKSVKLKVESEAIFEEGDYKESTRLANESILYAEKSDAWITMMRNKYKANSALKRVKKRLIIAKRLNAKVNFPEAMAEGQTLYDQADQLYKDESFIESYPIAIQALEVLEIIKYVASASNLPAFYTVMNIPGDEDCLWNIAGFESIYGDALEWKRIYLANKDILPDPNNPNLIIPGLILKIPSINGEKRSGTWINGSIQ